MFLKNIKNAQNPFWGVAIKVRELEKPLCRILLLKKVNMSKSAGHPPFIFQNVKQPGTKNSNISFLPLENALKFTKTHKICKYSKSLRIY